MKRHLSLGTSLLLKVILVLASHIAGCGYQEERSAPQTAEVGTAPFAAAATIDKAHNLLNVRQPEEAERILREALEGTPDHAQLNNLLGAALVELSRFAEAEARFRRAAELDPTLADPLARLGWLLYEKQGKALEAKALLQQSLKLDPDHERARYTLGLVHQREGELDGAATVYASLLERIPSAEAHRQLGLTYLQKGELERAQRSLQEAARWSPYDPQTLVGLGQAMARQGKADSARLILKGAERIRQEEEELRPPARRSHAPSESSPIALQLGGGIRPHGTVEVGAAGVPASVENGSFVRPRLQGPRNPCHVRGSVGASRDSLCGSPRARLDPSHGAQQSRADLPRQRPPCRGRCTI